MSGEGRALLAPNGDDRLDAIGVEDGGKLGGECGRRIIFLIFLIFIFFRKRRARESFANVSKRLQTFVALICLPFPPPSACLFALFFKGVPVLFLERADGSEDDIPAHAGRNHGG